MAARPSFFVVCGRRRVYPALAATRSRIDMRGKGCVNAKLGRQRRQKGVLFFAIEVDGDARGRIDLDGLFGRRHGTGKIGGGCRTLHLLHEEALRLRG